MRFVCAPDSFKESMDAVTAARAMERGIRSVLPEADVRCVPVADGGEGTGRTLAAALGGSLVPVETTDAVGRPVRGEIAIVCGENDSARTAVVEIATAAGLELVEPPRRDARRATSFGVGALLSAALDAGAEVVLVGLGGSATTDAGAGMMRALGARFLDTEGRDLPDGGAALADLDRVDLTALDPRLAGLRVRLACDVDNPLLGPRGAAAVFAPQKGADTQAVTDLERGLLRWADVVEDATGRGVREIAGAGADGGLGAAFLAFFAAEVQPGAELVMDAVGLDDHLVGAHVVFTGEGSLDSQSAAGKAPLRVARRAAAAGVPTVVFGGRVDDGLARTPPEGVDAVVPIVRAIGDLPAALAAGEANLEAAAAMTTRLLVMRGPGAVD